MTQKLLLSLIICMGTPIVLFAGTSQQDFSNFRKENIAPRPSALRLPDARPVSDISLPVQKKNVEVSMPVSLYASKKESERQAEEKMDSVVRESLDGTLVSLQTFTYTETGKYLRAENFIRNGEQQWELYSYYNYEYDSLGRLIRSEEINVTDEYQNQRYEYGYTDDTENYAWEIYYYPNDETGELEPSQRGEYKYDKCGRPIDQTFFYWDITTNGWIAFNRETVSFDNIGRQTSYYSYVQNDTFTDLVGDRGEEYIYVGETEIDAEIDGFVWENGGWLKYERHLYTYDAEGRLVKNEFIYWNRAAQNWSGNDTYGPYGNLFLNEYTTYTYDESGRLSSMEANSMNQSGQYVISMIDTYTYSDLENGELERIREQQAMWQGPYLSMFKKEIQHFNVFGSETYYKNYSWMSGQERATDEEIRDIDSNNCYHGGTFYGFTNDEANTRYGQSKEVFGYAADWNGVDETPSYGMHWKGAGYDTDNDWIESSRDEFIWHDTYLIGNTHYEWEAGAPRALSSYLFDYDYNVLAEDIWAWPSTRERTPYKILRCNQYYDADGDGEWDLYGYNISYADSYYYSSIDLSAVNTISSDSELTEVARFDLSGRRLSGPAQGINLIIYSDGSTRKVVVR